MKYDKDRALDLATDVRLLAQSVKDAISGGGDVTRAMDELRRSVIRLDIELLGGSR